MTNSPEIKYGKQLDSTKLKKSLNKENSIALAKKASEEIVPGATLSGCPICKSSDFKLLQTIYNFSYYECCECNVAFVGNPPAESELSKIYNSDYYTSANKQLLSDMADFRVKHIAEPKFEYISKNITTENNSWLDIGCGIAEMLYVASQNGFVVRGLETKTEERNFGKKRFGVDIDEKSITKENISEFYGKWGVISLFGVLEHVLDPLSLLASIQKIQIKNDNLVLEVPHFPSLSAYSQIAFPEQVNRIMHPPLHLFLFSVRSLEIMLTNSNYEITNVWYFGQDFYEMFSTLGLFALDLDGSILHQKISMLMSEFQQVIDNSKLSEEVLLIAKRV
ncbi:MAG: class I SAM-dependent methyltransferase [Pseudomonadota bacterium]